MYLRMYEYPLGSAKRFRVIGFNGFRPWSGGEKSPPVSHDKKSAQNLARARRVIRDLILCNYFRYFCTFTFDGSKVDRYDYPSCKKAITDCFHDFRKRHAPDFRYLLVPERHKDRAWHFHGMVQGIPSGEFTVPDFITYRDRRTQQLREIRNTRGYIRWARWPYGHFDCSLVKNYEACATYVSKYVTKDLAVDLLGKKCYLASLGLNRPDLVLDEDNVPFPFQHPEYMDEFCKISWASGHDVLGSLLPSWYDDWCSDVRSPEELPPTRWQQEKILFEPLTGEQLSLLESSEQVPVPWDM